MLTIYHSTARKRQIESIEAARVGSWISLVDPSSDELEAFAVDYNLDIDLLTDAIDVYEAPRIERDGDTVYIFTRYCYPEGTEIATEPLLLIYTPTTLITVMRCNSSLFKKLLANTTDIVTTQKTKLLMQLLTAVNESFQLQLNKVSKRILRIRAELRKSEISNRDFIGIIELEEDLNEFLAALQPQFSVLKQLVNGRYLRLYEEDKDIIEDLTLSTNELIELTKSRSLTLNNIRQAYDAIATNNLNNTFKRLTSIAIFLTIPTVLGGLWGMNVAVPFTNDPLAFLYVLIIICTITGSAIWFFNRKRWL